jgi:gamma-D-glutamyl-L-lysine dipeptidyl-peptidase
MILCTKAHVSMEMLVPVLIIGVILLTACGREAAPSRQTLMHTVPAVTVDITETRVSDTPLPTMTQASLPTQTLTLPTSLPVIALSPTVTQQPENQYSVTVESAKVWDDPAHEGDYWSLQTELITGEHVILLGQQGEWSQIVAVEQPSSKDPRGYPGWVRSSSLVRGWPQGQSFMVVMVRSTILHENQQANSAKLMRLQLDVRLPVLSEEDNAVRVLLPDGRQGWIVAQDGRLTGDRDGRYPIDNLYETAETLVGIPYLWGGTTTNALDCSGFLYRLFHAYGITLARDANDQILSGVELDAKSAVRGSLIFTADRQNGPVTHVVMVWGNGQIIDAEPGRGVTIHPLVEWLKTAFWSGARAYLP